MRKNKILLGLGIVAILIAGLTDSPYQSVEAEAEQTFPPFYMTEEYQQMKRDEAEADRLEAEELKASIEDYNERQQEEAEKLFQEHRDQIEIEEIEDHPELYILANCVEAEAGNQDDLGKRYVCDVILNRIDDPDFPDTITDVISQKYQFTSFWDGGMDRWKPTEDTIEICREELESRQYTGLIYFTAGNYNPYGTPAFKHGDHYFSTK